MNSDQGKITMKQKNNKINIIILVSSYLQFNG